MPTSRGRRCVPPMPGSTPSRTSGSPSCAPAVDKAERACETAMRQWWWWWVGGGWWVGVGGGGSRHARQQGELHFRHPESLSEAPPPPPLPAAATRVLQAMASSSPPPSATPSMAATVGLLPFSSSAATCATVSCRRSRAGRAEGWEKVCCCATVGCLPFSSSAAATCATGVLSTGCHQKKGPRGWEVGCVVLAAVKAALCHVMAFAVAYKNGIDEVARRSGLRQVTAGVCQRGSPPCAPPYLPAVEQR